MNLVSRGRQYGDAGAGDLFTRHEHGLDAGSGQVGPGATFTTDPSSGGRVDDLGRHEVLTNPQSAADLAKIPGVVSRPMLGGLRTAHHTRLLRDEPSFDGSHVELGNRVSVMVLAPTEQLTPDASAGLPSLRVPPVSDPYGRMCANAQAAQAASKARGLTS